MNTNEIAKLLATPIVELSDADVKFIRENQAAVMAVRNTPEHFQAISERAKLDAEKKAQAKEVERERRQEMRRRAKDDAAVRDYLRNFKP